MFFINLFEIKILHIFLNIFWSFTTLSEYFFAISKIFSILIYKIIFRNKM